MKQLLTIFLLAFSFSSISIAQQSSQPPENISWMALLERFADAFDGMGPSAKNAPTFADVLKENFLTPSDESFARAISKKYWHWKLDTIRLSSSIKKRVYDNGISPLLAPLSVFLTRNYGWKVQVMASITTPIVFGFLFDQGVKVWDNGVNDPENGITSMIEKKTHAQEIVDHLQAHVDEIVDAAFEKELP